MEDLFVPRAGMSSTHMSNGCIIAALTCISWYNIFCMLYGPILKFLFDVGDSSSSKQSCWLHRTLRTPHESEVYGLTHVSPLRPKAPGWPCRRFCAVGSRAVVFPLLFSQDTCSSPSSSLKHTRLMECTKHFQTASVRDRHLSYFTRSASWSPCLDLHPGKLLNLWRLNFPPLWSLSLRFAQHMRTEVLQQCVSVSHCAVDGQVTNPPPANAQAMLWFIPV